MNGGLFHALGPRVLTVQNCCFGTLPTHKVGMQQLHLHVFLLYRQGIHSPYPYPISCCKRCPCSWACCIDKSLNLGPRKCNPVAGHHLWLLTQTHHSTSCVGRQEFEASEFLRFGWFRPSEPRIHFERLWNLDLGGKLQGSKLCLAKQKCFWDII